MAESCKVEAHALYLWFYQVLECEFAEIKDVGVAPPRLCMAHASIDDIEP